mmetsp:Transcript_38574/g.61624  ORF Transcript_38574/g.61624 Transcript_38574/m.61624 type:complete len:222 (+) Transcript_38574:227-892(+)
MQNVHDALTKRHTSGKCKRDRPTNRPPSFSNVQMKNADSNGKKANSHLIHKSTSNNNTCTHTTRITVCVHSFYLHCFTFSNESHFVHAVQGYHQDSSPHPLAHHLLPAPAKPHPSQSLADQKQTQSLHPHTPLPRRVHSHRMFVHHLHPVSVQFARHHFVHSSQSKNSSSPCTENTAKSRCIPARSLYAALYEQCSDHISASSKSAEPTASSYFLCPLETS